VDLNKIPKHLLELEDPIFDSTTIIDATHDLAVSYKPNTLSMKHMGLKAGCPYKNNRLHQRDVSRYFHYCRCKTCDIGNTSSMYAKAFF
jgi:orotidine-5'-phosphate decarboxylase